MANIGYYCICGERCDTPMLLSRHQATCKVVREPGTPFPAALAKINPPGAQYGHHARQAS
jgi:hypothetical protein